MTPSCLFLRSRLIFYFFQTLNVGIPGSFQTSLCKLVQPPTSRERCGASPTPWGRCGPPSCEPRLFSEPWGGGSHSPAAHVWPLSSVTTRFRRTLVVKVDTFAYKASALASTSLSNISRSTNSIRWDSNCKTEKVTRDFRVCLCYIRTSL